jgi:predicted MPP superfamily phosphohydrolase
VLPPGSPTLRLLHLSDAHLTPGRHRLMSWIRSLDALDPDLVVNTGDSIAHQRAVQPFLDSLGPLLDRPGVFVYGSNDMYSPIPKNPARYLWRTSAKDNRPEKADLPWRELGAAMSAAGWLDLNNRRARLKAGHLEAEVAGVNDSHLGKDRYDEIAGPADPAAALRLGIMHTPEPRVLDQFAADGFDLLLAGHTHGGQVCVPGYGAMVTNCGIDRERVSGLHRHPAITSPQARELQESGGREPAWLHVSAGLGTSPWAPVRFCCRPEATLLTLVPRIR